MAPLGVNGLGPTSGAGSITDPNGNSISNSGTSYTDTLGMPVLSINGGTYQYQNPSGGASYLTSHTAQFHVETNFGCSGIAEVGRGAQEQWVSLITAIILADDNAPSAPDRYLITYELTPNPINSGAVTGRIASITLPSGGVISYSYSGEFGISCTDGTPAWLQRTTPDGVWVYRRPTVNPTGYQETQVTDPSGNQQDYFFQGLYETERVYYQGTIAQNNALESIFTCYNGDANFPCLYDAVTSPYQVSVTRALGGLESRTVANYSNDLVTKVDEYGYGTGAVGPFVRETMTCYSSLGQISDRPSYVLVYTATGNPTDCSGTSGLAAKASYGYNSQGNRTSANFVTQGSSTIGETFHYNSNGTLDWARDFNQNQTSYSYGSSSCSNSFPTTVSFPMSLSASYTWNCYGGVVSTATDANVQQSSYSYDNLWRPTGTTLPSGGGVTTASWAPNLLDSTRTVTGSVTLHNQVTLDGLGRASEASLVSDPSGATKVDTAYDALGRAFTVTNPYRSTSDPTYGITTNSYDPLGRVTRVTHPDSGYSQVAYGSGNQTCPSATYGQGYATIYTDESGNQRRVFTDALGRVIEVDEPDPASGNSLTLNTCYSYDALNNLTGVSQGGQTRTYQYDMVSRLTSATTPEAGLVSFTYDGNGNVLTKTDARGVITCAGTLTGTSCDGAGYNALNQLTKKSYYDPTTPTATVAYNYGESACLGQSPCYYAGRRTSMTDGSGSTSWSYDTMGRVKAVQQTIGTITKTIVYGYNFDGSLASVTYPSGRTVNYDIAGDGNPTYAKDLTNSINYAQNAAYAPQGALASVLNGYVSGGFAGVPVAYSYNNRLLPTSISAGSAGSVLNLSYGYLANGNVQTETNNRTSMSGRSITYGYDSLNRLTSATTQATSGSYCWGQAVPPWSGDPSSYVYDRFGNLTKIDSTQCATLTLSVGVDPATNRLNGGFRGQSQSVSWGFRQRFGGPLRHQRRRALRCFRFLGDEPASRRSNQRPRHGLAGENRLLSRSALASGPNFKFSILDYPSAEALYNCVPAAN